MQLTTIPVGQLQTNCYIVTDETTKHCAILDPGDDSTQILAPIQSGGLIPVAVCLTHGHYDHTIAADDIVRAYSVPVYIHPADATRDPRPNPYLYAADEHTQHYTEGGTVTVGNLILHVMETPGHSRGCVTLCTDTHLFTGDTLFRDDCGRTDLPGGDMQTMLHSLKRLGVIEGDRTVCPGHGPASTLERERRFNHYLRQAIQSR